MDNKAILMNKVKFQDLKPYGKVAGRVNVAYDRVFNSGRYIGGKEVEAFENEWAEYCEAKYCVGVGNGFDAIRLACQYYSHILDGTIMGIYVPWKTCLPTWAAVSAGGFFPNPTPKRTYLVYIAVHIYGRITLPTLLDRDSILIEDCAQAHGSRKNNVLAGKFGKIACWSFYPTKNLGAMGDGGAITTDYIDIADYIREQKSYGDRNNTGINSRLDSLQAAILRAKLPYLDEWNEQRKENARVYLENINNEYIKLPIHGEGDNWHIFAIETDKRDELKTYLSNKNVETMIHYPVVPYPDNINIPEAELWTQNTLSLPIAPHVSPYICKQISSLINEWRPHD